MSPPILTTIEERVSLLGKYDLDGILVLEFDEQLASLDYPVFIDKFLIGGFGTKALVLGYDCCFGKNREGSPERIQKESDRWGFDVRVIPAVRNDDSIISSTKIRNALMEGNLHRANSLLGHPYVISGTVVRGHGKGKGLGFPTANLSIGDPYKLWPPRGVYAVRARHDGRVYDGMMNVGSAPTIKNLGEASREVEVHLFDFEGELYGERMFVDCHSFLRDEQKFPSPEALVQQLRRDRGAAERNLK
jgi:riboflavin kinase/FMN adenylyltransferase